MGKHPSKFPSCTVVISTGPRDSEREAHLREMDSLSKPHDARRHLGRIRHARDGKLEKTSLCRPTLAENCCVSSFR